MMLEGGFAAGDTREMSGIASLEFITARTPCPVVPMRAMKLEMEWQSDSANH